MTSSPKMHLTNSKRNSSGRRNTEKCRTSLTKASSAAEASLFAWLELPLCMFLWWSARHTRPTWIGWVMMILLTMKNLPLNMSTKQNRMILVRTRVSRMTMGLKVGDLLIINLLAIWVVKAARWNKEIYRLTQTSIKKSCSRRSRDRECKILWGVHFLKRLSHLIHESILWASSLKMQEMITEEVVKDKTLLGILYLLET